MATINFVRSDTEGRTHHIVWSNMGNSDEGQAISIPGAADMSVHVYGTVGGATVNIEGSNEKVVTSEWAQLHDANGDDLSWTVIDKMEVVAENSVWIRPKTVGGSTTDVTVAILFRSTMR